MMLLKKRKRSEWIACVGSNCFLFISDSCRRTIIAIPIHIPSLFARQEEQHLGLLVALFALDLAWQGHCIFFFVEGLRVMAIQGIEVEIV